MGEREKKRSRYISKPNNTKAINNANCFFERRLLVMDVSILLASLFSTLYPFYLWLKNIIIIDNNMPFDSECLFLKKCPSGNSP